MSARLRGAWNRGINAVASPCNRLQEHMDDAEQKISRPRQIYIGADQREYLPIANRGVAGVDLPPCRYASILRSAGRSPPANAHSLLGADCELRPVCHPRFTSQSDPSHATATQAQVLSQSRAAADCIARILVMTS